MDDEWSTELKNDPSWKTVVSDVRNGENRTATKVNGKYVDLGKLVLLGERMYFLDDQTKILRRVVPPSQRRTVFDNAHSGKLGGHAGAKNIG